MELPAKNLKQTKHGRRIFSFDSVKPSESVQPIYTESPSSTSSGHSNAGYYTGAPVVASPLSQYPFNEEDLRVIANILSNKPGEAPEEPRSGSPFRGRGNNGPAASFRARTPTGTRAVDAERAPSPLSFVRGRRRSDAESSSRSSSPESSSASGGVSFGRARGWDLLRQRVLVSGAKSLLPPGQVQHSTSVSSTSSSSSTSVIVPAAPLPRPPTPKISRFARPFTFRQVVDSAREVAAVDDSRRFAEDVQRTCWAVRVRMPSTGTSGTSSSGFSREQTMGSSLYNFPFMTSSGLPAGAASASIVTLPGGITGMRRHELKRPQSLQSLAASVRPIPSVNPLLQTLLHHAPTSRDAAFRSPYLPHENQVQYVLLAPFLTQEVGGEVDEERRIAVEAFEVVVKTWKPETKEIGIGRCIWCCKAASVPSTVRMRVLGVLESFPHQQDLANTPSTFQTLIQALFLLLHSLSVQAGQGQEVRLVINFISKIQGGAGGNLNHESLKEVYGVPFSISLVTGKDTDQNLRDALVAEALARCVEHGGESSRRWILKSLLDKFWLPLPASLTPLLKVIHTRKLETFGRAAVALVQRRSSLSSTQKVDAEKIAHVLQTRVLPEVDLIGPRTADVIGHVATIVLGFCTIDNAPESLRWATSLIGYWYQDVRVRREYFENTLQQLIVQSDWLTVVITMSSLFNVLLDSVRKPVIEFALPHLYDRMIADPPPHPSLPLTNLLDKISQWYPPIFYRPLLLCAGSSKETTIVNHLCTISALSVVLPDFWTRDAEMMSVALVMDVGGKGKGKAAESSEVTWGKARLGQSVLLLELAWHLQTLKNSTTNLPTHAGAVKFANDLESRLSKALDEKEANISLVPIQQRILFCVLFLQIRLFTRSLKPTPWISRVISWLTRYYSDSAAEEHDTSSFDKRLEESANALKDLYTLTREGSRSSQHRRGTLLISPPTESSTAASMAPKLDISSMFTERIEKVGSLSKGFAAKALDILVTMSGILTVDDCRRMGPLLWNKCLDSRDAAIILPACFLTMQCAEKTPTDIVKIVQANMLSANPSTSLRAIQRMSSLANWRYQIFRQHVITDRTHRGPFRLAKDPLPFVATDMGTVSYVHEDDPKDKGDAFPVELRKKLSDIGWQDNQSAANQRAERMNTPMSLLPIHQLDLLSVEVEDQLYSPPSPSVSPVPSPSKSPVLGEGREQGSLTRKSSFSTAMQGTKRRVVLVPALAAIFPHLAMLVFSTDVGVAATARNLVMDLMRNDSSLLSRPIFDLLVDNQKDSGLAISTIRAFLHVRRVLPPAMTHLVFNSLAGYLKYTAKQTEAFDTFHDLAHILPSMAKLATQVGDMSIREVRRSKMEVFVIPSGSLWFSSLAPPGSMFPRTNDASDNPFNSLPARLISIVMIRISQNMFFLALLRRNAHDLQLVRKNMSRLVLPSRNPMDEAGALQLKDFVPTKTTSLHVDSPFDKTIRNMSLLLSRSHLLLVAQIFRSMSRHLSDLSELAMLIDGVNQILLVHGDDIGIVAHAMIALMVASTRFRRLFASGGGFTLFMPSLLKTYSESESQSGVREAIVFTIRRFYALHGLNFVFQSLDKISHLTMIPGVDGDWIAQNVCTLFSTLHSGTSSADAAGIHEANKLEERDALMVSSAEQKPQAFLSLLRQGGTNGKVAVTSSPFAEYEQERFRRDDLVRLFLTVIAHDMSIVRAQQFLRLLRFLAPHLYNSSVTTRTVLGDGIDRLGLMLMKTSGKTKVPDASSSRPGGDGSQATEILLENQIYDKSKAPSDPNSMRVDYLSLVTAFTRSGGQLRPESSQRTIELVKAMLKDSSYDGYATDIASFVNEFAWTTLVRLEPPTVKEIIAFLETISPIISVHGSTVGCSRVFDAILRLVGNPTFSNQPDFARYVVHRLCAAGLAACQKAASDGIPIALPFRQSLITLMATAIFLQGADVIAELEKRAPSYQFLSGIVLPFALVLGTKMEDLPETLQMQHRHRHILSAAWVRLLSYAMAASLNIHPSHHSPHVLERTKTQDKHRSLHSASSNSHIAVLVIAIQLVKIIVLQADDHLSSRLPGIWCRIASFFMSLLDDGNARFSLQQHSDSHTPASSHDRHPSFAGLGFNFSMTDFDPATLYDPPSQTRPPPPPWVNPRVVDYLVWSLCELLCRIRNPLFIQMRLFMQERVLDLDQALRSQQSNALKSTPSSRRSSSYSIFSKPRRRTSRVLSPDSSELLGDERPFPHDLTLPSPGSSPSPRLIIPSHTDHARPKHHHLGPIHSPIRTTGNPSPIPGGDTSLRMISESYIVRSPSLVRATYLRIRFVQTFFGYDTRLLPLPDDERVNESEGTWSRRQAFDEAVKETAELMEEFGEDVVLGDDGFIEDLDKSGY